MGTEREGKLPVPSCNKQEVRVDICRFAMPRRAKKVKR